MASSFSSAAKAHTLYEAAVHRSPADALIVAAGPLHPGQLDPGVRMVATPGLLCTATATSGARQVVLGLSRIDAHGSAVVAKHVVSVLKHGRWMILGKCGTEIAQEVIAVH